LPIRSQRWRRSWIAPPDTSPNSSSGSRASLPEEQYVQEVKFPKASPPRDDQSRKLTSDLLLVRPSGGKEFLQFRDVFAVDGQPVRDRQERLTEIFLSPNSSTYSQTVAILFESARYNIGSLERTMNVPLLPLRFLEAANQQRFKFSRSRRAAPDAATLELPAPPGTFSRRD
jgi:hypothetical protein